MKERIVTSNKGAGKGLESHTQSGYLDTHKVLLPLHSCSFTALALAHPAFAAQ